MFENLLAQDEVRALLRLDIEGGSLPPTLLFAGAPGSGKMTTALELARVLSCAAVEGGERAPWNCPCQSCAQHRLLSHPDLLLLGGRTFPEEIPAALELFGRAPGRASYFFFVRAARKLLRRFDAALFQGEEPRLAKAAPLVREAEELFDALDPEVAGSTEKAEAGAETAAKIAGVCAKLEAMVADAAPVFQVRNAELWARLAPFGMRKTVVIENADRMQESARNALLKILEEPPETVRFVLLSSRRSAMMATILSRSRSYAFARRGPEETALVLERVFRSAEPAADVDAFLAARRVFPPGEAREAAASFLSAALAERSDADRLPRPLSALAGEAGAEGRDGASALAQVLARTKDFGAKDERYATSFGYFLEALAAKLGGLLREDAIGTTGLALVSSWADALRHARADYESYNRSPSLLAESLLYEIGGRR
ncbi:MAG: DNA polymerase III [Treponema sp.]|nr:DNA polymerase III [Treponema sp.]